MSATEDRICPRSESGEHEWKRAWDPTEETFRMYCPACGHYGANADSDPPEDDSLKPIEKVDLVEELRKSVEAARDRTRELTQRGPCESGGDHAWHVFTDLAQSAVPVMRCLACGLIGANADSDPPEDNSGMTEAVVLRDATGEPYKNELPPPQDLQPEYLENVHERRETFAFDPGDEVIVILQARVIRAGGGEVRVELRTEGSLHGWVADFAEKYVAPTMSTVRNRRPT
jgi:hypothetical protein